MGAHLILFNHDTRKSFDLGKIRGGGAIDHILSNHILSEDITEQMFSDYRDQVLVENVSAVVELVRSDSERHSDLLSMKFRHFTAKDILFHEVGKIY